MDLSDFIWEGNRIADQELVFDKLRDSYTATLKQILIAKGIFTEKEFNEHFEAQLEQSYLQLKFAKSQQS